MLTKDKEPIAALERDPATAPLDGRLRSLVDYALKLTIKPGEVSDHDLAPMRAAGLADSAIHDAAAITAYFNFVNRMASGLGVELEEAQR